ncbi:hypothetical protein MKZ17_11630 [Solibacillus sp. FSL R7-0682]|uniref:hypothetical protein n=1 Tax=Solibacillus sp. FSL R7-0682 TaxID=2921690 RepID=UPI0030F6E3C0
MKKTLSLILSLAFISTILLGCQSEEDSEKLKLNAEVIKVSISNSQGNSETIFEDDASIEIFNTIITSGVKIKGFPMMANPEFYMDVVYENENKQSFHLWIGEKGEESTIMKIDDTHNIYTISEKMTDKWYELIELHIH